MVVLTVSLKLRQLYNGNVCHDRRKNFIFPGPSGGTALVPYLTVTPTTPGILAPQNSITTLGAQLMHASPTPTPLSSIKEQLTFAIAAPQPSRLIIPPDVQHSIRKPSPLQVDQYMSSPSPPIPDQAIFLGGDNDACHGWRVSTRGGGEQGWRWRKRG